MVFQQFKVLVLAVIAAFRRALCCFSRRRKPSLSQPVSRDELLSINVVTDSNNANSSRQNRQQYPERDWNSWDDSPRTVQEHIEQYRQRIAKPPTPQTENQEPNFFRELEPVIQPQPKYFLGSDSVEKTDFSRLEAKTDVPIALNPDLEDWEEDQSGGWEELDAAQAKQLIREKRKEMRNQRQLKKSQGIDQNPNTSRIGAAQWSGGPPQPPPAMMAQKYFA